MARPVKLSPSQRTDITRRLLAGEGVRSLAKEYGVAPSMLSRWGVAEQSQQVRAVAQQVADADTALSLLPVQLQHVAVNLADKLRNISASLACAAELGAATAHRLHELANGEVVKIDDADPLASIDALKGVAVLTRMGNDSAVLGMGLLAANKDIRQPGDNEIVSRIERAIVRPLVRHAQEVTTIENATDTDS